MRRQRAVADRQFHGLAMRGQSTARLHRRVHGRQPYNPAGVKGMGETPPSPRPGLVNAAPTRCPKPAHSTVDIRSSRNALGVTSGSKASLTFALGITIVLWDHASTRPKDD